MVSNLFWIGGLQYPSSGFRYYRFYCTKSTNTSVELLELQFQWDSTWQTNAMTNYSAGNIGGYSATISAIQDHSAYEAWKAFNGNFGSGIWWTGAAYFTAPNYTGAAWIKVDFGSGVKLKITGMKVRGANTINPVDFILQGSNDDSSWVDITGSSQTGQDTTSTQEYTWTWAN